MGYVINYTAKNLLLEISEGLKIICQFHQKLSEIDIGKINVN